MTKKRFTISQNGDLFTVRDTVEKKPIGVFEFKENEFPVYFCFHKIIDLMNDLSNENEQLKKALVELKEIGDYQEGRIKELNDENEHLESELEKVVEVCRKYGIYKEELQYVLADFDKMLNENGERAIRYKYCVNSR